VEYFFTNLVSAVSFLENVTGPQLNISDEEFERYMLPSPFIAAVEANSFAECLLPSELTLASLPL